MWDEGSLLWVVVVEWGGMKDMGYEGEGNACKVAELRSGWQFCLPCLCRFLEQLDVKVSKFQELVSDESEGSPQQAVDM